MEKKTSLCRSGSGTRPLQLHETMLGAGAKSHTYKRMENPMKPIISIVALALALAVTGPAFAGDVTKATDKASCDKAGGMWDDAAKKCAEKKY